MGHLEEFSLPLRLFLKSYRWRRIEPVPWNRLSRPLREARVSLVTSAGFHLVEQPPFDRSVLGGDWSFREIPADADPSRLRESHRSDSFDHSGLARDPEVAFPLRRLRVLAAEGYIGEVNRRHFSFMGSITAPGRLVRRTAPQIAAALVSDEVDVALLVPV